MAPSCCCLVRIYLSALFFVFGLDTLFTCLRIACKKNMVLVPVALLHPFHHYTFAAKQKNYVILRIGEAQYPFPYAHIKQQMTFCLVKVK